MSVVGSVDPLQLWILTSQVEGMWPLSVLAAPNVGHIMNLHFPTVSRNRLADALQVLFEAGLVHAESHCRSLPWVGRGELERWIESKADYPDEIRLGLTATGGQVWEKECKADWSRYLNSRGCRGVEENGQIFFPYFHFEGAALSRLAEYATRDNPRPEYVRIRMKIRELRPWKATYWKLLPAGYRISCRYRLGKEDYTAYFLRRRGRGDRRLVMKWYEDPPRVPEDPISLLS
jgi:hypothetical protein